MKMIKSSGCAIPVDFVVNLTLTLNPLIFHCCIFIFVFKSLKGNPPTLQINQPTKQNLSSWQTQNPLYVVTMQNIKMVTTFPIVELTLFLLKF